MKSTDHSKSIESVLKEYGYRLRSLKSYNSLYKKNAAYRATTDQGVFLVKPFYRTSKVKLSTDQQIRQVARNVEKLQESGFLHMPRWSKTKKDRYWVEKDDRPFYITEWIEGRPLQFEAPEYQKLGSAIATLHTICKDKLSSSGAYSDRRISQFKNQDELFRGRMIRLREEKSETGRWLREYGSQCIMLAEEAWKIFSMSEVAGVLSQEAHRPALVHGDITFPNLKMDSSDQLYILDWDGLREDSVYYEIGKTMSNVTHFNPMLMEALLAGYESVKPLQRSERLLISAFYRLPREAWVHVRHKSLGKSDQVFQIMKQTWQQRLEAVRWMDQWARQGPKRL